jgi:hypothetical protein
MPCNSCDFDPRCADVCQHSSCATGQDGCAVHGLAHPCEACAVQLSYEQVLADHRRLVRELDVLLNGENAAPQASLCDIVSQLAAAHAGICEPETRDREADRLRFFDPAFNRWLDEGITDAGHTVWDQIGSVADAWQGWMNRIYYAASPDVGKAQAPSPGDCKWPDAVGRELLAAGLRSGDVGAFILAAQLAGVPACDACGYRKEGCRCAALPEGRATTDATDGVTAVDVTAEDYRQQIEALLELFDSNNAVALRDEFSHARALLAHGASPSAGPTLGAADPDTLENER